MTESDHIASGQASAGPVEPEFLLDSTGELLPPPPTLPRSPGQPPVRKAEPPPPVGPWSTRWFWPCLLGIASAAVVIGGIYVNGDHRLLIAGDGLYYHEIALRLADGLGFTLRAGRVRVPTALHPPAWTALLAGVSWLGGRSVRTHQWVDVGIGFGVVLVAGMVGRRYFNARVGLLTALLAVIYPGFWLLDRDLAAEPLALLLLGLLLLLVADLRDRPTIVRSVAAGLVGGMLALTHSEALLVVALVTVPMIVGSRSLSVPSRLLRVAVVSIACLAVIAPWSGYNTSRFAVPVYLSNGLGNTLLSGYCEPGSFRGDEIGLIDTRCSSQVVAQHPNADESQLNARMRQAAVDNIRNDAGRVPIVMLARLGRIVAVYEPANTVDWRARSMAVDRGLIWLWVASFWVLLVLAILGTVVALRSRIWCWPLLATVAIPIAAAVVLGEVSHTMADLGVLVLAGVAIDRVLRRRSEPRPAAAEQSDGDHRRRAPRQTARLPSVHVPR